MIVLHPSHQLSKERPLHILRTSHKILNAPSTHTAPTYTTCLPKATADRTVVFAFTRALHAGYACIVREDGGGRRRPCHPAPPWWCCPAPPERLPPTVGAPLPAVAVRSQVVAVRQGEVFWDTTAGTGRTRHGAAAGFVTSLFKLFSAFCPSKRWVGTIQDACCTRCSETFALIKSLCAAASTRGRGPSFVWSGFVWALLWSGLFASNLPLPAWIVVISTSTEQQADSGIGISGDRSL